VLDSGPRTPDEGAERDPSWLRVKCSGCGNEWTME
jgi:ribosomal protein S27E